MRTPRLAAAVVVALVLSACASGNSERTRNIALPTTTALAGSAQVPQTKWQAASNLDGTARVSSCIADSYQAGGCLGPPIGSLTMAEYDKVVERQLPARQMTREVVRPSDTEWSRMKRVSDAVGVVSVIARLAINFDTASMARALRNGQKFDDAAWAGSNIKHVSPDAGVAAATIALRNRLGTMPGYSSRTYDPASLLSAMTSYADATLNVQTGGKATPASFGFAQIAIGPFVRLNASTEELDTLMTEGMIAGVQANTMEKVSLDDSIPLIGADKYTQTEMPRWEPTLAATPDGTGSVVSVIDDGVMESHPSLRGRMIYEACYMSVDFTSSCPDGFSDDAGSGQPCRWSKCSHGTHVAGIAVGAASTLPDGRKVPAGIAPGAQYMSMRVCNSENCERAAMIAALNVTAFHSQRFGISVANMSISMPMPSLVHYMAEFDALMWLAREGVPLVHAQGNSGQTDYCDVNYLSVWEVAASGKDDTPADFTNFKEGCTDVWAPGVGIVAPVPSWTAQKWLGTKSGTSMAAPHVAGAIAIIHQGVRLVNSRLPEPSRLFSAGVIDYYLGVSQPDGLTVKIADDRTVCRNGDVVRACSGSGASVPRMSLHRIRELFSPPGNVYSTYWTDEMRAQRLLIQNSSRPAATTTAARNTTRIDLHRRYYDYPMDGPQAGKFSFFSFAVSTKRTFTIPNVGDESSLSIAYPLASIKRGYVFVRDGELDSLNTIDPVTGATKGVPYVEVSSGPVACASSGYYSVYELTTLTTDPRFGTLPVATSLRVSLKGPAPRTLFVVVRELRGSSSSTDKGTMMISTIPATVGVGLTPQELTAPGTLHVGDEANFNLRMIVTNDLPTENDTLPADLVGPVHPNALALPDRRIRNVGETGFAIVRSNYGPRVPSEFGFGRVNGRQSCHNILLSVYEGW